MKKIVIFTGAGISAESGLKTFRDSDGLWENYDLAEVATPEAWEKNPALVLDFYNLRRRQIMAALPNEAHKALVKLEKRFDVQVITQNIDNLHERAGSSKVLHLHGEIMKARSTEHPSLVYELNTDTIRLGDTCEKGSQLRPHIVWFGEMVPEMERAYLLASRAEIFIVVGTSLNVYPAAGLLYYVAPGTPKYLVDPGELSVYNIKNLTFIKEKAGTGVPVLTEKLLNSQ